MKKKYECDRCKTELVFSKGEFPDELKRLGWVNLHFMASSFIICPYCVQELKRFLAGLEIEKLKEKK